MLLRIVGARSAEQFDINIISILADVIIYFKRKAYDKLLEWKKLYSEKYAVLLEGARRVGKSTIAPNSSAASSNSDFFPFLFFASAIF